MIVLAGDVGGTNARLALVAVDPDAPRARIVRDRVRPSDEHGGLAPVVRAFLDEVGEDAPEGACLAVAGPVRDGRARLPNLGWELDARELAAAVGMPGLRLINDFDAVAWGLELLGPDDVAVLQPGSPDPDGVRAVIGAGTGLGEGFVVRSRGRWDVHSSEGGHVDFAPRTPLQCRLWAFLRERHDRVSWERVVSGPGLVAVYEFLREEGVAPEDPDVRRAMEEGDPAPVISRHALRDDDPLSARALDLFIDAYGARAGNLALTVQATGGVWIAGGIAPAILDRLRDGGFIRAFRAKGRMSELVESIPVRVITNTDVGLLGAALAGARAGAGG